MSRQSAVTRNIRVHDRIARKYEARHGEIANQVEQSRLRDALSRALALLPKRDSAPRVVDFGCGAGNLTRHLVALGCDVIAADVSVGFLDIIRERYGENVETVQLNGRDLSGIASQSVDMIATYSVLHHIPDYLALMDQFAGVVRPGGLVYIDHEQSPQYWAERAEFDSFAASASAIDWRKFLTPMNYLYRIRRIFEPRFSNEGDIHVWPDDHIEWDKIEARLAQHAFAPALCEDYLLFRRLYDPEVYAANRERLRDMRFMAFQRNVDGG